MNEAMNPDITLGDPVDLWAGLEPRFPSWGLPWRRPQGRPLRTEVPDIPSDVPVQWDLPSLSFHESVADLLDHIFDYSVTPMVGLDGPHDVSAGALMAGNSLAGLEARLTMNLTTRPAAAYLLARLDGRRGARYYTPEWEGLNRKLRIMRWLTPEGRNALARLRLHGMRHEGGEFHGDITARQARRYLGYFHDLGTHVVRSISYGERLFQVFEVDGARLSGVRDAFVREAGQSPLRGPAALGMAHFTRRPWVTKASPILSASEDPQTQQLAHGEIWMDGETGEPGSLLSPRAMAASSRTAVLNVLPACSPVAVSFACQALYLEDFRADAWDRIMRAGLCQRFPGIRLSGWRQREPFPLAAFLASAALVGEEALCKPPDPALPDVAFMLDLRASGRIAKPASDCLALFAATNPGAGRPAEHEIDDPAFDPDKVNIPFLDGALCLTAAGGERSCLVEGAWLGRLDDGRPGIKADPAVCDGAVLTRHAGQLAAYLRLIGQMQGAGFPFVANVATRRCAAWLVEATSGKTGLAGLRWQALRIARGAGQIQPGLPNRVLKASLARLLESCMDLLALHPDSEEFGAALRSAERLLHAFYRDHPDALDADELDRRSLAAGEAVQRRFADLHKLPDLSEQAAAVFSAGAALCLPPDPRRTPHAVIPGDDPYATLWNALLGVRARYAECRAFLAAAEGRTAEAITLLEREVIDGWDIPPDPAGDVLAALEALSGSLPGIGREDRDRLAAEISTLLALSRPAHLLQLACASRPEGKEDIGPQLRRLLIVIEVLQCCRIVGIPLACLDSLAPAMLEVRIGEALTTVEGARQFA